MKILFTSPLLSVPLVTQTLRDLDSLPARLETDTKRAIFVEDKKEKKGLSVWYPALLTAYRRR